MKFQIGQTVQFKTRNGKGLNGVGYILEATPDIRNKYIVADSYTVKSGPYTGKKVTRRVMCLETELVRI